MHAIVIVDDWAGHHRQSAPVPVEADTSPSEDVQISIEQGPIAVADALPRTQLVFRRFGFPDHTIAATAMAPRPRGGCILQPIIEMRSRGPAGDLYYFGLV
jgi:hypothetical protein